MKIYHFFWLLVFPCYLLSQQVDTISVAKMQKKHLEELNYYNLTFKTAKKAQRQYYVGFDVDAVANVFNTKRNTFKKIQFCSADSVCYEQSNFKDTNFIWLIQKKKYQWKDTLRISESRKTGKIDLSEVYTSYKYLNPIKITIKADSLDIDLNNSNHSVMFWSGKKYIFTIPKVTQLIIYR
ncbi:MAG: hypothetical protein ACPLX7_04005 [Candidatus Kapaibacteriota bacterium]